MSRLAEQEPAEEQPKADQEAIQGQPRPHTPGIRFHQRVLVAGSSGSGKSELLNYLFGQLRTQRLLLDTKPEFWIPDVEPVHTVEEIDWTQPIIHFRDFAGEIDVYDQLFYEAHHRRNLTVCCHELADLCEDQPNRTPNWVRKYLRKGNIFGNGLLGGSQRLVGMPTQMRSEAMHVIHMVPGLEPDNHQIAAKMFRTSTQGLDELLDQAGQLGTYSCAWYDREARTTVLRPPLPAGLRARIMVRRSVNL